MNAMRYRLALDLGSTSLGWAMVRLNADNNPCAVIKAGVRIFPDGRNPKDGSSLAVTRRAARGMRRRRDRLLKRKARITESLIRHGFFPGDTAARKALETLNPYQLRAKGLDESLAPHEFGRALFHINQRRGFKSNRKTDKKDNDSGALKAAIRTLREALASGGCRTVGELLHQRMAGGGKVRARYREQKTTKEDGKTRIDKSYDLYMDRAMIEAEFDALWAKQKSLNPALFNEDARADLRDTLLFQRPLKPVKPGRCTLLPDEERAPLALPSTQRFRIYQELNNLRILRNGLKEETLTLAQRDSLAEALEENSKRTFTQIKALLGIGGAVQFNFEDPKRQELKGNVTTAILSKAQYFGKAWSGFDEALQDEIVLQLVTQENEATLIGWLQRTTGVDEKHAEALANVGLPEGYGALSTKALGRILPELRRDVMTYDKAVLAAGFEHHSHISAANTGEILPALPYYGLPLQRHVSFGSGRQEDNEEKRYGRIANPTVHIGLNQVRVVVNGIIKRYGHPSEVIVEVARDLKQSRDQREEANKRQAENQRRNARIRQSIAGVLGMPEERVRTADIQKWILWEELSFDPANRRCPYSGEQISAEKLLAPDGGVEIEHILPFARTLDDSLNNKTVSMRWANRIKANMTPAEAFGRESVSGCKYQEILDRAALMPKLKRYRFAEDGYERWLKDDKSFLARALNDTRYLSRIAREYLSLICPQGTRVIPGQMTAMLRGRFGLNGILGITGEKNREDHRHHSVDACVVGVTDQGLLQRFAKASASAREQQLDRLVETMPDPWPNYREHVRRAVNNIWISFKPDHSHEGAMHNDTAYALLGNGRVGLHKSVEGKRTYLESNLKVIEFTSQKSGERHGLLPDGTPRPYKGYKGDSNYCIEIIRTDAGKWDWEVVSTFEAYQAVRTGGQARLRHPGLSMSGKPLVMRLVIGDYLRANFKGEMRLLSVKKIKSNGGIFVAQHNEGNVRQREDEKDPSLIYGSFSAGSLQKAQGRYVTVSPIGELHDPGFKG